MMSTVGAEFRNAKSQSAIPLGDFIYEQMIPQAWQNWNQRDFSAKFDLLCVRWLLHVFIDPSQFENEPKKSGKQISYLIDTTKMLLNAPKGSISIYIEYIFSACISLLSRFCSSVNNSFFKFFSVHSKNTKKY